MEGEIIGKWESEKSLMGEARVLFTNSSGQLIMRDIWKSGEHANYEITESVRKGSTRYDYENGHGEYYILESNGNLGMYDESGKFDEAVRLD